MRPDGQALPGSGGIFETKPHHMAFPSGPRSRERHPAMRCWPWSGGSATRAWSGSTEIPAAFRPGPASASARSRTTRTRFGSPRKAGGLPCIRFCKAGTRAVSVPRIATRHRRGGPSPKRRVSRSGLGRSTVPGANALRLKAHAPDRASRQKPQCAGRAQDAPCHAGPGSHRSAARKRQDHRHRSHRRAAEPGIRNARNPIDGAPRTLTLLPVKTLEDFDFSFQPFLDRERIAALAPPAFVRRAGALYFHGPPGTGKSPLATAPGGAVVKAGSQDCCASLAGLIDGLIRAERQGPRTNHTATTAKAPGPPIKEGNCQFPKPADYRTRQSKKFYVGTFRKVQSVLTPRGSGPSLRGG